MNAALRSLLLVATPFLAVGLPALLAPRRVDLLVLNGSAEPLTVTVGPDAFDLEPGAVRRLEGLAAAPTRVTAAAAGGETVRALDLHLVAALGSRPTWVCEVAGVSSFHIVSRGYGDRAASPPPPVPFAPTSRPAFRIPEELLQELDGDFPAEVQADRRGSGKGAVRAMLWTGPRLEAACPPAEVAVDNGLRWPLRLEVDGLRAERPALVDAEQVGRVALPPGRHRLRATELLPNGEDGPVHVADVEVPAAPFTTPPAWIWNVGGLARSYKVVTSVPAGQAAPKVEEFVPPGLLFQAPPGFQRGLDRPLPERVAGVVRTLWTARRLQLEQVRRQAPVAVPGAEPPGGPR